MMADEAPILTARRRSMFGPRPATLLALLFVGAALAFSEAQKHPGGGAGSCLVFVSWNDFGWPKTCLVQVEEENLNFTPPTRALHRNWDYGALATDIVVAVAVVISTAFACERLRRRKVRWWQFSLRSVFLSMTISTLAATLYLGPNGIRGIISGLLNDPAYLWEGSWWFGPPLYVIVPMLFGIGCCIYALGALTWTLGRVTIGWAAIILAVRPDKQAAP